MPKAAAQPVGSATKPGFSVLSKPLAPTLAPSPQPRHEVPRGELTGAEDADLNELQDAQDRMRKTVEALAGGSADLSGAPQLAQLPAYAQGYLRLVSMPQFTGGIQQIAAHPDLKLFYVAEGAWGVFMLVFRAWRAAKARHWFRRLWISVWTTALFAAGALAIPYFLLGEPFSEVIRAVMSVL